MIPKVVSRGKRSASNAKLQVHIKKESLDDPPKNEPPNNEEDEWKQLSFKQRMAHELHETYKDKTAILNQVKKNR